MHAKRADGGLSMTSVNKTLTVLRAILKTAVRYGHVERNTAEDCRLPAVKFRGSHLDRADQIAALLDAAGELDGTGRLRRGHGRALLAVLVFAGLRIDEALSLRWRDLDLARGTLRVRESKTAAGERTVDLLPPLLDELTDLAARRQQSRDSLVFGTTTGGKDSASNVRRRLLAKAAERANAQLDDLGVEGLPERLTPHSLRRTFASLLVALGEDPGYVMDQLGHEKAEFTLSVYRRSMKRKDGERERLRALVEGSLSLADLDRGRSKGQGEGNKALVPLTDEREAA